MSTHQKKSEDQVRLDKSATVKIRLIDWKIDHKNVYSEIRLNKCM